MPQPGVGIDVTSVERIAGLLARQPRFATRVFTELERRRCGAKPERWAGRWAAKEAMRKLYGVHGLRLPDYHAIEVRNRPGGAPGVAVEGMLEPDVTLSITHDAGVAIAVVVGTPRAARLGVAEGVVLPERPDDGNKGSFGTVVVVAGAHGYSGAAVLASTAAARAGAGLVRLCVPDSLFTIAAVKCTEVMANALPDGGRGTLGPDSLAVLRERHLPKAAALVVGPGLGQEDPTPDAVEQLLTGGLPCPVVVDADALNIAAARGIRWSEVGQPVVLTPHPAEMARLLRSDVATVQADRQATAARYAVAHGVVLVLKGAETVVAAPDGRVHVDTHRLVSLATGGTGDVLGGVVAALLGQRLEAFDAAVAGVTIHAAAGAMVQERRGRAGALAGDLLEVLPEAQERVRRVLEWRAASPR